MKNDPKMSELLILKLRDLEKLLKMHEKHERYEVCKKIKKAMDIKKQFDI